MARTKEFEASMKKFKDDFSKALISKIRDESSKIGERVANAFVESARNKLETRATPKGSSKQLIDNIKRSMYYVKLNDNTYSVRIPMDSEGLVMFLEYGTGLQGTFEPHPEAGDIGWNYAVNGIKYINYGGKRGFIFKEKDSGNGKRGMRLSQYLDENDIAGLYERREYVSDTQWVKGYTRKDGTVVKRYVRTRPKEKTNLYYQFKPNRIFSQGLKPVRFIYDTKQQILELLAGSDRDIKTFQKKLDEIAYK